MTVLRVAVLGPGGVGGLVGVLLARAGDQVTCLAGAVTVSALRTQGLRLTSKRYGDVAATVGAEERLSGAVDVCLVTVKATQLEEALQRVPAEVLGDALVVPLLNGVEHVAALRERYPDATVVAATIRVEASRTGPGQIRHDSPFASVELTDAPGVAALAEHLESAGLDVTVRDDETGVLWDKLAFLAPLALLTTHTRAAIGVAREQRGDDLRALVAEAAAAARGEGATGDEQAVLTAFAGLPEGMRSSMQRDAEAGRPLELAAIGGAVLRAAQRHDLPTPVTQRLVDDLRAAYDVPG